MTDMKVTIYILGVLIAGLYSQEGFAQKTAGAVMEIKVEVVQGLQTASLSKDIVVQPSSDMNNSVYGRVEMQLSENADYVTSFYSDIKLMNRSGEEMDLKSSVKEHKMDNNRVIIEMSGKLHSDRMKNGVYLGSQVARIDFF